MLDVECPREKLCVVPVNGHQIDGPLSLAIMRLIMFVPSEAYNDVGQSILKSVSPLAHPSSTVDQAV